MAFSVQLEGGGAVGEWNSTQLVGMVKRVRIASSAGRVEVKNIGFGHIPDQNRSYLSTGETLFHLSSNISGSSSGITAQLTGKGAMFAVREVAVAADIPNYPLTLYTRLIYGTNRVVETDPLKFTLWGLSGMSTPLTFNLLQRRGKISKVEFNGIPISPIEFEIGERAFHLTFQTTPKLNRELLAILKRGYHLSLPILQKKGKNLVKGEISIPFDNSAPSVAIVGEVKKGVFKLAGLLLKVPRLIARVSTTALHLNLSHLSLALPGGGRVGFNGNGRFPFAKGVMELDGNISVVYLPFIRLEQFPEKVVIDTLHHQITLKNLHAQLDWGESRVTLNLLPAIYLTPFAPLVQNGEVTLYYSPSLQIYPKIYLSFPFITSSSIPNLITGKVEIGDSISVQTPFLTSTIGQKRITALLHDATFNLTQLPTLYLKVRKQMEVIDSNITLPLPVRYLKRGIVVIKRPLKFNTSPILHLPTPAPLKPEELAPPPPPLPFLHYSYRYPTYPPSAPLRSPQRSGKIAGESAGRPISSPKPTTSHPPVVASKTAHPPSPPPSANSVSKTTGSQIPWEAPLAKLDRQIFLKLKNVTFNYHSFSLPIRELELNLSPRRANFKFNRQIEVKIDGPALNFKLSNLNLSVDKIQQLITQLRRDFQIPQPPPSPPATSFHFPIPRFPFELNGSISNFTLSASAHLIPIKEGQILYRHRKLERAYLKLDNGMVLEAHQQNDYLLFRGGTLHNRLFEEITGAKGVFTQLNLDIGGVITPADYMVVNINLYDTIVQKMKLLNNIIALLNLVPSLLSFQATGFSAKGYKIKKGAVTLLLYRNFIHITRGYIKGKNNNLDFQFYGYIYPFTKKIDMKVKAIINLKIKNIPIIGKVVSYILFGSRGAIVVDIKVAGKLDDPSISLSTAQDLATSPFKILSHIATLPFYLLGIYHPDENEELQ